MNTQMYPAHASHGHSPHTLRSEPLSLSESLEPLLEPLLLSSLLTSFMAASSASLDCCLSLLRFCQESGISSDGCWYLVRIIMYMLSYHVLTL